MGGGNSTPGLVSTLERSKDESVKEIAAEKLCAKVKQYNQHNDYMKAVCKSAGPPLVTMLEKGTSRARNHAAATISYLALNADNKVQLGNLGAIPALAKMAKEGTPELQGAAAAAIANLTSRCPENQATMATAGAIPPLVLMVKSGLGEAKGWAASALGNMALQHKKNQLRVAEAGAIPALVDLTKTRPQDPQPSSAQVDLIARVTCRKRATSSSLSSRNAEMAARALSSIAYDSEDNQAKTIRAGGFEALLALAKEGSSADQVEAFRALGIVWGRDPVGEARSKILGAGGVRILLEIVQSGSDDSQATAANMIARLAHLDAGARESVAMGGGIPMLLQLGQNGGPVARLNAVKALRELCTDCPENEKLIEEAGGTEFMDRFKAPMKFRELNAEEQAQLNESQAKLEKPEGSGAAS